MDAIGGLYFLFHVSNLFFEIRKPHNSGKNDCLHVTTSVGRFCSRISEMQSKFQTIVTQDIFFKSTLVQNLLKSLILIIIESRNKLL